MATFVGTLPSGSMLNPITQDDVISKSGRYQLVMQRDGNLVLYDRSVGRSLWSSETDGQAVSACVMQTDGNLVIYGFPNSIWDSGTVNHPDSFLVVQDDGNVVIRQPGAPIWDTETVQQP